MNDNNMKNNLPLIRKAVLSDIAQIRLLMEQTFGFHDQLEKLFTKWITQDEFSVFIAENKKIF